MARTLNISTKYDLEMPIFACLISPPPRICYKSIINVNKCINIYYFRKFLCCEFVLPTFFNLFNIAIDLINFVFLNTFLNSDIFDSNTDLTYYVKRFFNMSKFPVEKKILIQYNTLNVNKGGDDN
jgi:hypothetical protein